jgi:uncharacterized heparinase superfamily protein
MASRITQGQRLILLGAGVQAFRRRFRRGWITSAPGLWLVNASRRLVLTIIPQDLHTIDPVRADDLHSGLYDFAGKVLETHGRSPFLMPAPSADFEATLHGFLWLRHLRGANSPIYSNHARFIVETWLKEIGASHKMAWTPAVIATRIRAFLSNAGMILEGANALFYGRYVQQIMRDAKVLEKLLPTLTPGPERIDALISLTLFGLCMKGQDRFAAKASDQLGKELSRQILPDGGPLNRNPGSLVDLLADLLPLKQVFLMREKVPPKSFLPAIDRMIPALRFFRGGDGSLAVFNGTGPSEVDLIATLLRYDESLGHVPRNAPHSGFARLEQGNTILICDAGAPPPRPRSRLAHAGTLSFELWFGTTPLIVNCGLPRWNRESWREACRVTAAHSTLILDDTSSATFGKPLTDEKGSLILSGPRKVPLETSPENDALTASHDGYNARLGFIHERSLTLERDGRVLLGIDRLIGKGADKPYVLRFHLNPLVQPVLSEGHRSVLLPLSGDESFVFTTDAECQIEDSVFLAAATGAKRCKQIVVSANTATAREIHWRIERHERPHRPVESMPEPELPL